MHSPLTPRQSKQILLFSLPFDAVTQKEALDLIEARVDQALQTRIVTINPEFIVEAEKNNHFKKALQTADLRLADGIGIIWATHIQKQIQDSKFKMQSGWGFKIKLWWSLLAILFKPKSIYTALPERVTGSDLFIPLIKLLADKGQSIFLLGAAPGVAETVAAKLGEQITNLRIAGTYSGSPSPEEAAHILQRITASKADALFVAFQFPKQDIWIAEHLPQLPQVKLAIGIGGTFDFVAGTAHKDYARKAKRAPKLLQALHLEWLWRLLTQPYRWRRISNATISFIRLVEKELKSNFTQNHAQKN